jgi:hypothetical protein
MLPSAVFGKRKQRDAQQDAWQMQAQSLKKAVQQRHALQISGICLCTQDMLQLLLLLFTWHTCAKAAMRSAAASCKRLAAEH